MRTSITTTSGWSCSAMVTACNPSGGLADDRQAGVLQ
jgi:hypothetical protein